MYQISTFATANKQSPQLKDEQHFNAVHKDMFVAKNEKKLHTTSTKSTDVSDEKRNLQRTLTLLDLAKWAQEQQFEWKGSPNVGINHDTYFVEAAEAAQEAKRQASEFDM